MSDMDGGYDIGTDADINEGAELTEAMEEVSETAEWAEWEDPMEVPVQEISEPVMTLDVLEVVDPEEYEEDDVKVLTREITPEVLESRMRDTEEVLENYRENLRDLGVTDEQMAAFINQEREKIYLMHESLDAGDTSHMYEVPGDWEAIAQSLSGQEVSEELEIDYDEIYEGIEQEALEQGFEDIDICEDEERLDSSLENFQESTWENISIEEQKAAISDLAEYIEETIGFENPPHIEYYNNPSEGDYGGYSSSTNTLSINEYMLYNSSEAADTVAHELWHAHQRECAENPRSARDYQYQYNFQNYIPPELDHQAYEEQLIEAEARAFAAQFKERLANIAGRS